MFQSIVLWPVFISVLLMQNKVCYSNPSISTRYWAQKKVTLIEIVLIGIKNCQAKRAKRANRAKRGNYKASEASLENCFKSFKIGRRVGIVVGNQQLDHLHLHHHLQLLAFLLLHWDERDTLFPLCLPRGGPPLNCIKL